MMVESIAIIGGGSGLGEQIAIEELEKKNLITVFTSKSDQKLLDKNISYFQFDFFKFDYDFLKKIFFEKKISKVYFCSVVTTHELFKDLKRKDIENQVTFNITNVSLFIHFLLNNCKDVKLVFILSHICFIFSPGFAVYRMSKKAIEDLLFSLEIEYPSFSIVKVYPGAMDTNFVKNTNYSGISLFKKQDPRRWAKIIVNSRKSRIISKTDFFLHIFDYLTPFKLKKFIYNKL